MNSTPRVLAFIAATIAACPPLAFAGVADIDWPSAPLVTHAAFNAINDMGLGTYSSATTLRMQGIILNNPEDMLGMTPFTPNPVLFNLGASWQVFIQPIDPSDHGGTAVFMGQHYGNVPPNIDFSMMPPSPMPSRSYTDAQWKSEMLRVNYDRTTGHKFRAGDYVEIHAQERLFFGGKLNVNEAHVKEDIADFELQLITPNYGLPNPHNIQLSDIWTGTLAAGHVTFDNMRSAGGEFYQGSLVKLFNVKLVGDGSDWIADKVVEVADADGRHFNIQLGHRNDFNLQRAPTGYFNVSGIFDQEDTNDETYDSGYLLWVMSPDAVQASLPGDYDGNGIVNGADYSNWQSSFGSTSTLNADGNGNGIVDASDYVLWRENSGTSLTSPPATSASVPEPISSALLIIGIGSLMASRQIACRE